MATELVHVGFGNYVALNRVVAVVTPNSAPIQRLVRDGKKRGIIKDMTQGRRTKSVLFMDDGSIVLAAITPEAIYGRAQRLTVEGAAPEESAPVRRRRAARG
ncbi:hypothetical protein HRbin24_01670 [bacterium HR24]|jgi:regulator of extracellular matrix RemA (YlzA/DUF370 family)|nr:hypothetical protein HRbin24_01670 [bacterium HR24]